MKNSVLIILLIGFCSIAKAQSFPELQLKAFIAGMGNEYWTQQYGITGNFFIPLDSRVSLGVGFSTSLAGRFVHYLNGGFVTNSPASFQKIVGKLRVNIINAGRFRFSLNGESGMMYLKRDGDDFVQEASAKSFIIGFGTGVTMNIGKGITWQIVEVDWYIPSNSMMQIDRNLLTKGSMGINFQLRK